MKRRLLKIAVLLVLGAILNVAVAWGLVLSQPLQAAIAVNIDIYPMFLSNHYENRQPSPAITWVIPERDQFRETRIGRGARLYQRFVGPRFIDQPDPRGLTEWRAAIGWPQLAVVTNWQSQDAFIELYLNTDRWLIRQARWPRFPGFAINTIFYAAILWLLFAAPVKLRRWRRIKRGLCPACAYPVGGSDICTECGGNLHSAPASRGKRGLQGAAAPCTRASDHNT